MNVGQGLAPAEKYGTSKPVPYNMCPAIDVTLTTSYNVGVDALHRPENGQMWVL